jgi:hypothetical protein
MKTISLRQLLLKSGASFQLAQAPARQPGFHRTITLRDTWAKEQQKA